METAVSSAFGEEGEELIHSSSPLEFSQIRFASWNGADTTAWFVLILMEKFASVSAF